MLLRGDGRVIEIRGSIGFTVRVAFVAVTVIVIVLASLAAGANSPTIVTGTPNGDRIDGMNGPQIIGGRGGDDRINGRRARWRVDPDETAVSGISTTRSGPARSSSSARSWSRNRAVSLADVARAAPRPRAFRLRANQPDRRVLELGCDLALVGFKNRYDQADA